MFETLSTAVVELDRKGCVERMNTAAEHCLATARERARSSIFQNLDGIPGSLADAVSATANDRHSRQLRECRLTGGLYDCNIQSLPQQHILLEFYDLKWQQEHSKLQQRAIQTGMMDLLRRNLGHEIRNPLGGIRGAAQMMAAELHGGELSTLAELIIREVDRIDELLARFGQPELEMHNVDLHWVITEAAELLQLESADQVRILQDFDPSIPQVIADASALRQLFLNLVRNAFQAGATKITLRSRVAHGVGLLKPGISNALRLDIDDNGQGVPESLRDLLFLPLVTGRRDGTGLGLALAQQVAAAHQGLLTYEPLQPGSRFTLILPLEPADD